MHCLRMGRSLDWKIAAIWSHVTAVRNAFLGQGNSKKITNNVVFCLFLSFYHDELILCHIRSLDLASVLVCLNWPGLTGICNVQ